MKQSYILLLFLFTHFNMYSQANWEIGLNLGGTNYLGDLNENWYPDFEETKFGYGAYVKRYFSQNLGLALNYKGGIISGDDANFDSRQNRGMSFTTRIDNIALLLDWEILAKNRYKDGTIKKIITPFVFGGPGFAFYTPETNYNENSDLNSFFDPRDLPSQTAHQKVSLNLGGGLRIDLSEQTSLGLEFSLHSVADDWLDGVSYSGDTDNNDLFMHYGVSLSYRLGMKDTDKDGLTNAADFCPEIAGLEAHKGCPDTDKDGIRDLDDACPTLAGSVLYKGCPDTDNDGITDDKDNCPDLAGPGSLKGCPDMDGDGITDADDACPNMAGVEMFKGCPDTDKDGIEDKLDNCPTIAGPASFNGCPFVDKDADGIPDTEDACPTLKGSKALKGCPDGDNDGVADKDDRCPQQYGLVANGGCPEMKKEEREALTMAVRKVEFQTGSDKLTAASLLVLDKVADMLKQYPNYKVTISGHTDSRGEVASNQKMSEKRANSCSQYLISKGVDATRLKAVGYGESKPIASNLNEAGRTQNRRVEFELTSK
ncbi:MAG: OmpA family protein [Saprospiraceae bacterium]|nr:OmpA family protein [Saprospiraceae bacterium]